MRSEIKAPKRIKTLFDTLYLSERVFNKRNQKIHSCSERSSPFFTRKFFFFALRRFNSFNFQRTSFFKWLFQRRQIYSSSLRYLSRQFHWQSNPQRFKQTGFAAKATLPTVSHRDLCWTIFSNVMLLSSREKKLSGRTTGECADKASTPIRLHRERCWTTSSNVPPTMKRSNKNVRSDRASLLMDSRRERCWTICSEGEGVQCFTTQKSRFSLEFTQKINFEILNRKLIFENLSHQFLL